MSALDHRRKGRAALLLEVVVALAIMTASLGMLGAQLISGLRMTAEAEELTRSAQLADRMLAVIELDPNTLQQFFESREVDGDFESTTYPQFKGWFWRAGVEELPDNEGLGRVTIEILHEREADSGGDIEDARVVRTLHLLKADPGRIDLAADFGMTQDQLAQLEFLSQMAPVEGLDPTALDPQALISLDPETLMQLLPMIMPLIQQFSGGQLPSNFSPDMIRQLLSGAGLPEDLANMIPDNVDLGNLPGAGGGPSAGGPGGGGPNAALREMILSQLGGQISEEELNQLLSNVGQGGRGGGGGAAGPGGRRGGRGGGGGGNVAPPPGGGNRGAGGAARQPRTIEDLDRQRDQRGARRGGR